MTFTLRTTCRGCDSEDLVSVLDLGEQPLANAFRTPDDTSPEWRYPLHLLRCVQCELVQLSGVVDPAILYGSHYAYRSGFSEGWALHCHDLARDIGPGKKVLEIGCLDGVLLRECRDKGCDVQGIDPSSPVQDLPIIREFFGRDTNASDFDVIVAQNVFGHVDDAEGFLIGIRDHLLPDGYAIIEAPWVVDLIDGVRWDTIYAEHLSYWGLRPLKRLAQTLGLQVSHVQMFPEIHGGTARYTLTHAGHRVDPSVYAVWDDEEMMDGDWKRFRETAWRQVSEWMLTFSGSEFPAPKIAAYGASAKLSTFLNTFKWVPVVAVFDDTPAKQGLVTPGHHIPVLSPTPEHWRGIDTLLIGASNWAPALEARAVSSGFTGTVVQLWPPSL